MRYTLIELRRHQGWTVSIAPDEEDREHEDKSPHALGFYYAPRAVTVQASFAKLRDFLVEERRKLIKALEREVEELESLGLPEDVPTRPTEHIFHEFEAS